MKNTFYINIDTTNYRSIHEDGMYIVFSSKHICDLNNPMIDIANSLDKELICNLSIQNGRLKFLRTYEHPIIFVDIHNKLSKYKSNSNKETVLEDKLDKSILFNEFLQKNLKDHETHPNLIEIDSIVYFKANTVKFFTCKMADFKIFLNNQLNENNSLSEAIMSINNSLSTNANQNQIKFKIISLDYRPNSYNCKEDENILLDLHLDEIKDESQYFNKKYFNNQSENSKYDKEISCISNISSLKKSSVNYTEKNNENKFSKNNDIKNLESFVSNEPKICKVKVKTYKEIYDEFTNPTKKSNSFENLRKIPKEEDSTNNNHIKPNIKDRKILNCTICMEKFNNKVSLKPCQHEYCLECIENWKKNSTACPICKANFTQILSKSKILYIVKKVKKFHYKDEDIEEEQEWYDNLLQYCMACKKDEDASNMLVCDICNRNVCHYYCDNLKILPNLDEPWNCSECRQSNSKGAVEKLPKHYKNSTNHESNSEASSIRKKHYKHKSNKKHQINKSNDESDSDFTEDKKKKKYNINVRKSHSKRLSSLTKSKNKEIIDRYNLRNIKSSSKIKKNNRNLVQNHIQEKSLVKKNIQSPNRKKTNDKYIGRKRGNDKSKYSLRKR